MRIMKIKGGKIYQHKENGSIILARGLNRHRSVELVGRNGREPDFFIGVSSNEYKKCGSNVKVLIKTSTEYSMDKDFAIATNEHVFFHCENDKQCSFIRKGGWLEIKKCSFKSFESHIRKKKIVKDVLEFRNREVPKALPKTLKKKRFRVSSQSSTTGTYTIYNV